MALRGVVLLELTFFFLFLRSCVHLNWACGVVGVDFAFCVLACGVLCCRVYLHMVMNLEWAVV